MVLEQRLSKYRNASGISQEKAAEELNVSRQTISRWEHGLSVPSAEYLVKLSELYHVPVNVLVEGPDETADAADQKEETVPPEEPLTEKPAKPTRIKALVLAGLAVILWTAAVIAGVLYFQRRNEAPVSNHEMKVEVIDPSTVEYIPFIPFE